MSFISFIIDPRGLGNQDQMGLLILSMSYMSFTISRKSWAPNLFVCSDLTFDPPFKVKLLLATFDPFPLLLVCEILWVNKTCYKGGCLYSVKMLTPFHIFCEHWRVFGQYVLGQKKISL